mmetsp:Transcript_24464/g.73414  ORF Transcript_24464/g.73414 Transcript_24464/m.73414 type:complete len:188 (+) Transcript_24464:245-808(+)
MAAALLLRSTRRAPLRAAARAIATGDDARAPLVLQRSRPWHMDGTSNDACDNAVPLSELFGGRKVALFGVPAPFTGTCTQEHVPPYAAAAKDFKAKGVDEIVCFSVACPYAMDGWREAMGVDGADVSFLCDDLGEVSAAWDLAKDYSGASLGTRSERFSMLVEDGKVTAFQLVDDASADAAWLLSKC